MRASQMTRAQTYISATLTVLSGIAVYCFFAFEAYFFVLSKIT